MENQYVVHVRQYDMSPIDCNELSPHWGTTFSSLKNAKAAAKEIAQRIRAARENRCACYVEIYKNGRFYEEYRIVR